MNQEEILHLETYKNAIERSREYASRFWVFLGNGLEDMFYGKIFIKPVQGSEHDSIMDVHGFPFYVHYLPIAVDEDGVVSVKTRFQFHKAKLSFGEKQEWEEEPLFYITFDKDGLADFAGFKLRLYCEPHLENKGRDQFGYGILQAVYTSLVPHAH
jgi:hypothetical protein